MPRKNTIEFIMRLFKTTKRKVCFRDNMDRIGKLYLPLSLVDKMNISDEIIVQLAPKKSDFPTGGYVTRFVYEKETTKKIRFTEDIAEIGELGIIYISKSILEIMGLQDEIAVRVVYRQKG
ncbi:hypothetical protein [Desulfoscipio gibsoniae]|uniref:Uncharacterized protein n=1 Tax=Desulfoscipio gibsoniae DSM 7213 TaxID=767817 RepID=R4KIX9_9FIRM|nr:hypothetical protein [Desulfoscipio gibsoniae]AGL03173.1 hypothetical protein Desgi_3864 [Desulfoscipio gibsoniae DSM 7213]